MSSLLPEALLQPSNVFRILQSHVFYHILFHSPSSSPCTTPTKLSILRGCWSPSYMGVLSLLIIRRQDVPLSFKQVNPYSFFSSKLKPHFSGKPFLTCTLTTPRLLCDTYHKHRWIIWGWLLFTSSQLCHKPKLQEALCLLFTAEPPLLAGVPQPGLFLIKISWMN